MKKFRDYWWSYWKPNKKKGILTQFLKNQTCGLSQKLAAIGLFGPSRRRGPSAQLSIRMPHKVKN